MSEAALPDVSGDWFAAMRRGDWEAAWRATDRIELPRRAGQQRPGFRRRPEHLRWDGTPVAGRTVLVRCEHGLGDTLQFMRFVPCLQARHVHFMVQPQLLDLLRGRPGLGDVRNYWTDDPLPAHEVDLEVMELPYALRMTLPQLPPPSPDLAPESPEGANFGVADDGRLHVGLLFASSDWDPSRSIPLTTLAPLFDLDGVQFHSLQQGSAAADPLLDHFGVRRMSPQTQEIARAAAAMRALDLVISIDGMPAHLAATLGRPTWVMLKHDADWRWMHAREDSPWYPTMRLFRQPREGDWDGVARQVAQALQAWLQRQPHAEVRQAAGQALRSR